MGNYCKQNSENNEQKVKERSIFLGKAIFLKETSSVWVVCDE